MAGLMDYLTYSWTKEDLRKAAILINLQDFLSCYFEVAVEQMSDTLTGRFTMIIICAAVSTMVIKFIFIYSFKLTFMLFPPICYAYLDNTKNSHSYYRV